MLTEMQNRLSAEAAVAARLIEHGIFRLLLGVGVFLALALSFNCTRAAAQPITPQSQIVDVMRDPKWIESLRSHLDGDTSPFIEEPLSRSNRFFYVGSLLNNFGKGCGSSISINSAAT